MTRLILGPYWLFILGLLLILSIPSYTLIPFFSMEGAPWGVDLHNLWAFHNCLHANQPYGIDGGVCGDGNSMNYPPAMYWLYIWIREIPFFPHAVLIWNFTAVLAMTVVAYFWTQEDRRLLWLWLLLVLQFPFLFALERANNDFVVVVVWTLAACLTIQKKHFLAGVLAGLAVSLKVYPLFAIPVLVIWSWRQGNRRLGIFLSGLAAGFAIPFMAWPAQSEIYWFQVLPRWGGSLQSPHISVHSIFAAVPGLNDLLPALLGFGLWGAWGVLAFKKDSPPLLIWAGGLAISTFFAKTSNDYNLLTVYPLFLVLAARSLRSSEEGLGLLAFGMLTVLGYRYLWKNHWWNLEGVHVLFQVLWLVLVPLYFLFERAKSIDSLSGRKIASSRASG